MAAKTCPICQNRPMYTGKGPGVDKAPHLSEMCNFCYTEGGIENQHNDDNHDAIKNGGADPDEFKSEDLAAILQMMETCWICHPELNLASKAKRETTGTSRAGMRLTVPVRASGKVKAEAVKAQLPEGYSASIRTEKGRTTLRASCKFGGVKLVLHWDAARGGFVSGTAQATNGTIKRVRNASEALRAIGV